LGKGKRNLQLFGESRLERPYCGGKEWKQTRKKEKEHLESAEEKKEDRITNTNTEGWGFSSRDGGEKKRWPDKKKRGNQTLFIAMDSANRHRQRKRKKPAKTCFWGGRVVLAGHRRGGAGFYVAVSEGVGSLAYGWGGVSLDFNSSRRGGEEGGGGKGASYYERGE